MSPLFRQQVLQPQTPQGQAVPWHVPQLRAWAWLLLLWLIASLLWLAQLSYAEKVSVEGVVQPAAAPIVVRSPVRGVVKVIHTAEAEQVGKQQALLVLDNRHLGASGVSDVEFRLAQNRSEQRLLHQRQQRLHQLHQQQQNLTHSQQQSARAQAQVLADQLQLAKQRTAVLQTEHRRAQKLLQQQWLSPAAAQQSEVALLSARQNLLSAKQGYQSMLARQRELSAQMKIAASQHAEQLAEVVTQLARLEHDAQRLQAAESTLLPAPAAGRVVDLLVQVGRHVEQGDVLLTIMPPATTRHPIDVLLPSMAAGRVRAGMPVRLRYAGYPYQEHGSAVGKVSYVSEVRQAVGHHPLFRARIRVSELPESIDHVPAGMVVHADILLRSQSLWRWLWQPLYEALVRL